MSNQIPSSIRAAVNARDANLCQVCGSLGTEIQHRVPRRDGGHDMSNLIRICRTDHARAHREPSWAMDRGITVSRYGPPPSSIPIQTYRGWVVLDDGGGVRVIAPRSAPHPPSLTVDDSGVE